MAVGITVKNLIKRFGSFTAIDDISVDIAPGEFITILGPSGCGKTTALRLIAGFIDADEGEIYFNDRLINKVEASKRNTAMVFQSYALFPHKSVYENVRFGLRMKKAPLGEQPERIKHVLEMVDLSGLEKRMPYELSGGQQQRVALARAIVTQPDVLLFDEPLSNLDAKLRDKVREDIRRLQRDLRITTVYVTHDQTEALSISDRIIVMNKGKIEQISSPRELYEKSRSIFVADFIGAANLLEGVIVRCDGNEALVETQLGRLKGVCDFYTETGEFVTVCIRPEDILASGGHGEANTFEATVTDCIYTGGSQNYLLRAGGKYLRSVADKAAEMPLGSKYVFHVPKRRIHIIREVYDSVQR